MEWAVNLINPEWTHLSVFPLPVTLEWCQKGAWTTSLIWRQVWKTQWVQQVALLSSLQQIGACEDGLSQIEQTEFVPGVGTSCGTRRTTLVHAPGLNAKSKESAGRHGAADPHWSCQWLSLESHKWWASKGAEQLQFSNPCQGRCVQQTVFLPQVERGGGAYRNWRTACMQQMGIGWKGCMHMGGAIGWLMSARGGSRVRKRWFTSLRKVLR